MSEEGLQAPALSAQHVGAVCQADKTFIYWATSLVLMMHSDTHILDQMARLVRALAATAKADDLSSISMTHMMRESQFLSTFHGTHPSNTRHEQWNATKHKSHITQLSWAKMY